MKNLVRQPRWVIQYLFRSFFLRPMVIALVFLLAVATFAPIASVYAQSNIQELPVEQDITPNQNQLEDQRNNEKIDEVFGPEEQNSENKLEKIEEPTEEITGLNDKKDQEEKIKKEKPADAEPQVMALMAPQATPLKFQVPTQNQASVDQSTGALVYNYPISLPEGRNGMTPELSLDYNSRSTSDLNTFTGLGWEVSIPYIKREPIKGTQNLYTKAFFSSSISGNLIATTDTSSSPYTTYRPESDNGSYLKYVYNSNDTWTVTGKDGKTITFGGSSASRQDNPNDATKVYKWMVSKIADAQGNEIQYTYTKQTGQIYPDQIVYTYHASSAARHTVTFSYTTPSNYGSTIYNAGFPVTTSKLLSTIVVSTTIDSQTTTHTHTFNFTSAQFIKQKLLTSVQVTHSMHSYEYTQSFNDTTSFTYSNKSGGWEQGTHSLSSYLNEYDSSIYKDIYTRDFDANGYQDVLISNKYNSNQYNYLLLNNGSAFTESGSSWSLPTHDISNYHAIVDVNGDRLPDLHPRWYSGQPYDSVFINTGSGFTEDTSGTWMMENYVPEASCGPNAGDNMSLRINSFLYDINNDGKNDIIWFGGTGSGNFKVFLNDGSGWNQSNDYTFTPNTGASFTIEPGCGGAVNNDFQTLMDYNGDGLLDYYHQQYGTYLNTGTGFAYSSAYFLDIGELDRSGFADINGDGLMDYIGFKFYSGSNKCARVLFNNGAGFTQINPTSFPPCANSGVYEPAALKYYQSNTAEWGSLLDVTADGFIDIVGAYTTSTTGKVRAINDGKSLWVDNPNSNDVWTPIINPAFGTFFDINSDNITDFITPKTNWDGTNMASSKVYMGKSAIPNRLTQINNPLGAQTLITYGTVPTNQDDQNAVPISVVNKVSVENIGHGQPNMVSQYSYTNGTYVADTTTGQKRFAGFHKVTKTESGSDLSALRITETYYHQANGSDSGTSEPTDTALALIGKPYYGVVKHPSSTPKNETWNRYGSYTLATEPGTSRLSKFVYPTETVNKITESSGSTGTVEVYIHDTGLGERTELRNLGFVTVSSDGSYSDISGDTRYEFTEYANNSGSTIVKPKRVDLRTTSSSSDTVSRTDYFYDNQSHGTISTLGNLTKETSWISGNGSVTADTTYTYDSFGNVLTITNPRSAVTTYTYDNSKSLVASVTNHLSHVTTYEYMTGLLKQITDPNGRVTTFAYSSIGLPYRTTVANTAANQSTYQFIDHTSPSGIWAIQTNTEPVSSVEDRQWQSIDNLGRPVRLIKRKLNHDTITIGGYFIKEVKSYDALGRQITTSAPYGTANTTDDYYNSLTPTVSSNLVTTTTYDVFDRPVSVVDALGTSTLSYAGPETTITDANNNQKKTKTDAYKNLILVKEYDDSNIYTTDYTYNIQNLLTGITDALGNVRAFTYNNAGWVTNSQDLHASADGTYGSYSYTYDLNGNQLVQTQPNGVTVTRVYDMLDRPTSIDGSSTGSTDYTLSYDSCTYGKGHVCSVSGTLPNSVTLAKSYVYGISGVPTSSTITTLGNTYTTTYAYNRSDEVSQITHPNNTVVRYAFGDWAKPYKVYVTLPSGSENLYATIGYHHTEQPDSVAIANGPTTTHTYDSAKLYRKSNTSTVLGGNTLMSYAYTYDSVNNITQIAEPNLTKAYTYDDLYRLTQAVHTPSGGQATTYTYAYNAVGNITSANGSSYSYSGTGKTNPHAVTSIGSDTFSYDDNGNMVTAPSKALTFNWQNQPTRITLNGSTNIDSYYDESGGRFIYQTPSSTEVQVDNSYIVRGSVPEVSLMLGNIPIGTINNNVVYSAIPDHLGTPVKHVNSSGTVVETVTYDPFGKVLSQSGSLSTKHGFTGYELDADTGLNYAGARYYSSSMGRFVSQDDVFRLMGDRERVNRLIGDSTLMDRVLIDPQQQNSYSYARNNPVTYVDKSGHAIETAVDIIVTALSLRDFYTNRTIWNGAMLGLDSAGLFVPFLPSGAGYVRHGSRAWKIANYFQNVSSESGKSIWHIANLYSQNVMFKFTKRGWTVGPGEDSVANLVGHFAKHGHEFGATTTRQYYGKANDFIDSGQGVKLPTNGDRVEIWDTNTNTLAVTNKDGSQIRTFYKVTETDKIAGYNNRLNTIKQ